MRIRQEAGENADVMFFYQQVVGSIPTGLTSRFCVPPQGRFAVFDDWRDRLNHG